MGILIEFLPLWIRRIRHRTKSHDHHLTSLPNYSAMTQLGVNIDALAHRNMNV